MVGRLLGEFDGRRRGSFDGTGTAVRVPAGVPLWVAANLSTGTGINMPSYRGTGTGTAVHMYRYSSYGYSSNRFSSVHEPRKHACRDRAAARPRGPSALNLAKFRSS
eukprot:SAG31_NODE_2272_length_6038_cov_37.265196_1_plen_107_part_00